MKVKAYIFSLLFIVSNIIGAGLFAQSTITGKVLNSNGKPVSAASISIAKLSLGTVTDSTGTYIIQVPADKVTGTSYAISVSYLGYNAISKEVTILKGDNKVDFTLTESVINLNAVDVTALKSKTTLAMQTPMAITVFSGKSIERMDYYAISDFIQQSPGVTTTQLDEAYMNVQIRGISSMAGGSAAGYYLDDVPFSFINSPLVPDVNPYDLNRIEILRGPQGTLYGNGAMSGVVRILTENANLSKFGFKVDLAGAATLHGGPNYEGQGELNVPIVKEKLGIRLTGGYLERGGFLTNNMLNRSEVNQAKLYYFRGKINYQATKRLSIRASYWRQNNNVGTLSLADDNFDRSNPFEDEANKNNFNLYNLTIEYKLPKLHFYSATSYTDMDATQNDGSPIFARSDTHLGQTAFSEEFRMNSVYKGHFNWLAGFYAWDVKFNQTTNITYALPTGGLMTAPYLETTTTSLQFAGFGELYYKFLQDRMTATAGLRYFHEKTDLEDKVPATVDFLKMLGLSAKRGMKTDHFSPRFNLAFNITPKSNLYLTASNGFRSGFVQSGAFYASAVAFGKPAPESVGNENLWSYELGTKVTTGHDRFTIEAAVYYNDWKGLIQTTSELIIVDSTITPIIYYINAGNASALGLDLNTQYSFPFGLSLGLGGNVNKSQYDEDTPASIGAKKGDRISFVPLYTLSASVNFVHKIYKSLKGCFYSDLQQSSERVDYSQGLKVEGDAITMLNLRIGVEGKHWGVYLYGNNLLNERGATYPSTALTYDTRLRPRTLGINLKFSY